MVHIHLTSKCNFTNAYRFELAAQDLNHCKCIPITYTKTAVAPYLHTLKSDSWLTKTEPSFKQNNKDTA